jgi:hypothetical protein
MGSASKRGCHRDHDRVGPHGQIEGEQVGAQGDGEPERNRDDVVGRPNFAGGDRGRDARCLQRCWGAALLLTLTTLRRRRHAVARRADA